MIYQIESKIDAVRLIGIAVEICRRFHGAGYLRPDDDFYSSDRVQRRAGRWQQKAFDLYSPPATTMDAKRTIFYGGG